MRAFVVIGLEGKKVLRIDRPYETGGFLSLTALRAEGCGIAFGDEMYCRLSAATLPEAAKTKQPRLSVSRLKGRPFYGQAMG